MRLADPARFDLRGSLACESDVEIDVNCVFEGAVSLGDGVRIGANCVIANARIATGAVIHPFTHIDGEKAGVTVGEGSRIGPFARLRPGARLGAEVHIGNFVEVKNSTLAAGAKANHLAYLGDATVGERVNYGAGSITANYDGANKHRTVIGDDVHVGSNCVLVAPVTIGAGGTVGGGSTVTKSTEPGALTVARARAGQLFELAATAEGAEGLTGSGTRGRELRALQAEEGLDVAHVGVAGEEALRQRLVAGHVAHGGHQHEIRPRRDAVALLHRVVRRHARFEGVERGGVLAVQRDLDHRGEQGADPLGAEDRDLALDPARLAQPSHAPQAGGRGDMEALGQRLVALRGILLQGVQELKVGRIDVD